MALTFVSSSAWQFGTGSIIAFLPSGTLAGDYVIVSLVSKYEDAVLGGAPAGWTDLGTAINTGRPTGNDNGNLRTRLFGKVWASDDFIPSLAPTPNNVSGVHATAYRSSTGLYDIRAFAVADDTVGATFTTGPVTVTLTTGDIVHYDMHLNGDAPVFAAGDVTTNPGVSSTTNNPNVADATSALGTDLRVRSRRFVINAGAASSVTITNTLTGTVTNAVGTTHIVRLREAPLSAVAQTGYRFYADGTESGSTALGSESNSLSLDLTNGDFNGQLRIRLQSTNSTAVPNTDDWYLTYEKNASDSWFLVASLSVVPYVSDLLDNNVPTTKRLSDGVVITGTFTPGDVTEDGVAYNQGWPGGGWTEYLYSIKVKAADFADGDVIRFRISRNSQVGGVTYDSYPTAALRHSHTY